jgi:hypothetical protein
MKCGRQIAVVWALLAVVLAAGVPHMHGAGTSDVQLQATSAAGAAGLDLCPACLLHHTPLSVPALASHVLVHDAGALPVAADAPLAVLAAERSPLTVRGPPSLG